MGRGRNSKDKRKQQRRKEAQPRSAAELTPDIGPKNIDDMTSIMFRSMFGLEPGASSQGCMEADWRGLPARELFLAAHRGDVGRLERLLEDEEMRKRINDFDNDQIQILHAMGFSRNQEHASEIVDLLVQAGADVNSKSKSTQETPLIYATLYRRAPLVKALLDHGARVDISDWSGKTPKYRAKSNCSHNGASSEACCHILNMILDAESGGTSEIDLQTQADTLRQKGNKYFAAKDYTRARELYKESLELHEDHRTFANRSLCSIELGRRLIRKARSTNETKYKSYSLEMIRWGGDAFSDAMKAAELEPSFEKAHYRAVIAKAMSRDFPRAKSTCKAAMKTCPNSTALQKLLTKLELLGVGDSISNPFYYERECLPRLRNGAEYEVCIYCSNRNPFPLRECCAACAMPWKDHDEFKDFNEFLALENSLRDFILEDE